MRIISGMVGWYPPIHYGRQTELLARLAGRCRSARSAAPQMRMTQRKLCLSAATGVDRRTHRHHPEPDPTIPVTVRTPPIPTFPGVLSQTEEDIRGLE